MSTVSPPTPTTPPARRSRGWIAWLIVVVLAVIAGAWGWTQWQARNERLAVQINEYKQRFYRQMRERTPAMKTADPVPAMESGMQMETSLPVAQAGAVFAALSDDAKRNYCRRYLERLDTGQFDLMTIVIRFSGVEAALAPSP